MMVKITLAKSAGFCFGVKRARDIAMQAVEKYPRIEMLGDIVHNKEVCHNIARAGIKKIKRLKKGENKVLLIRAHGAPLEIFEKAKKLGYKIIDATCPMVKEIHKIAMDMERRRYKIILIGDKDHDEVKGIVGHLKTKPLIIEDEKKLPLAKIKRACVLAQSTQNSEKVERIVNLIARQIKNIKFFNTICVPTRKKQAEIRRLPLENDIMIIIGSETSANTMRLYEIAKSLNKKSYWVQGIRNLKKAWFKDIAKIGVTAGASTPDRTTEKIIERIKELVHPAD